MKTRTAALALSFALAIPCLADDLSPHHMLDAEGKADMNKCAVCHTETLDLARPKSETCTLCHSETQHAGSYQHLHAKAAAVADALDTEAGKASKLPLDEKGTIYCGTCHLFHDPALSSDKPLAAPPSGDNTAFARAVRESLLQQTDALAKRKGLSGTLAKFPAKGTTALRLTVDDGRLCRTCHESYAR